MKISEQCDYINSNPGLLVGDPRPENVDKNLLLLFQAVVNGCMMILNRHSASIPYPPELQVSTALTQAFNEWWTADVAHPKYAIGITFTDSGFDLIRITPDE